MTKILDTTISDTGVVVSFSENDKRNPHGVIISMNVGAGDTLTVLTKVGAESLKAIKTYTATGDVTFVSLPDSLRIDRTTDGSSEDSTSYISQID